MIVQKALWSNIPFEPVLHGPLRRWCVWCDHLPSCVCSSFNQSLCDVYGATTTSSVCSSSNPCSCDVYGATTSPLVCVAASTRARVMCMVRSPPLLCMQQIQPLLVWCVWCDHLPSFVCRSLNPCSCDVYSATPSPLVYVAASTRARVMCRVRPFPSCVCSSFNPCSNYHNSGKCKEGEGGSLNSPFSDWRHILYFPTKMRCWANIGFMMVKRSRHWNIAKPTLGRCIVFAGLVVIL